VVVSPRPQLRERPAPETPRSAGRSARSRPRAKTIVIAVLSFVVVVGGAGFIVKTSIANTSAPRKPIGLDEFGAIASGDLNQADPANDALKEAAVQAYKAQQLKEGRTVNKSKPDWVERKKTGPGGDGVPQASFPPGSAPSPGSNKAVARQMLSSFGYGADQWGCLELLWQKESGWNEHAQNRFSGAYGIPQSLPGSKMASAGGDWQTNAATQIKWGLGYIKGRYGSPCGAWGHSQSSGWY
jgi:hypothetical protein